jgi:hypothetical protein
LIGWQFFDKKIKILGGLMSFVENASQIAKDEMLSIRPDLADIYSGIIQFLETEPAAASAMRGQGSPEIGSKDYIHIQATAFAASRNPRSPQPPTTVPDEMVSVILHEYFDVPLADLNRAKHEHLLSMGAENLIGDLLERYLASILEPRGWIWCSGSMVKAVDFIKPPLELGGQYRLLQVKNRDNSENSSSSAIRNGTYIEKWFRTFSRREGSNWGAFPDTTIRPLLSEQAFKDYVSSYLQALKI